MTHYHPCLRKIYGCNDTCNRKLHVCSCKGIKPEEPTGARIPAYWVISTLKMLLD